MFGVNTSSLLKLTSALSSGDDNVIERLVRGAAERAGERLIEGLISATPLGGALNVVSRIGRAIDSGGASELDRMRGQMLSDIRPSKPSLTRAGERLANALQRSADARRGWGRQPWQRTSWAKSRQQWLDQSWMHDWRSQPRNRIGEWIPGRLDHPVSSTGRPRAGRATLRMRRARRERRAMARSSVRGIVSSWSQ